MWNADSLGRGAAPVYRDGVTRKLLLACVVLLAAAVALPPLWYAAFPEPAPSLPPPGRRVEVAPGVGVNLIERGAGPAVVLVHGHPGSAYDWTASMEALADRGFRALAYDRVGYGRSDVRPRDDYSVGANAAELLGLLTAEDLRHVILVGWSYGGATSITAARRDASRIDRLVLVGSVGPGIEQRPAPPRVVTDLLAGPLVAWIWRVPPVARRVEASFVSVAFAPEPVPEGAAAAVSANLAMPHSLRTARSEGFDLDGRADLDPEPIERPILLIHGEGDLLVPPAVAEGLHRSARRSKLRMVPSGGHALPVTRPDALADWIADFARAGTPPARGADPAAQPRS